MSLLTLFDDRPTNPLGAAKLKIQQNAADVGILVIGDSTGNESTEWVYLFGQYLAGLYPTHSVSYRLWDDAGGVYAAASAISTGSGARTIRIWNFSVSGSNPQYVIGAKFAPGVSDLTGIDLVFWSHGQNMLTEGNVAISRGRYLACMEMTRQAHPAAGHCVIVQNPRRDDSTYDYIVPVIREIASDRTDTAVIDVYSQFYARGRDSGLYADNIHPSATGSVVWRDTVAAAWNGAAVASYTSLAAWLDSAGSNLLANGDFSSWTGAAPDSWTLAGAGTTSTKDAVQLDPTTSKAYSCRLNSTAVTSRLSNSLSGAALTQAKGSVLTLAVRQYVGSGQAATAGRIAIAQTGSAVNSVSSTAGQGGWRWMILSGVSIATDSLFVRVELYCDTAASAGSVAYFDRAVLVIGDIPRDLA